MAAEKVAFVEAMLDPEGCCIICHEPSPSRIFYARYRDNLDRLRGVCYPCVSSRRRGVWQIQETLDEIKQEIRRGDYD